MIVTCGIGDKLQSHHWALPKYARTGQQISSNALAHLCYDFSLLFHWAFFFSPLDCLKKKKNNYINVCGITCISENAL